MLVDPISLNFLIAQIAYATLKYLKNSGGLRPPPGAQPLGLAWGFAPVPKFELHIATFPAQVRCTSTFFAAMVECKLMTCKYLRMKPLSNSSMIV